MEYKSPNGDVIIFDAETYFKIAVECAIEFGKLKKSEAIELLLNSWFFNKKNYPPKDYNSIALLDNETIYSITMMAIYGENYWQHPNYININEEEYFIWENELIEKKGFNEQYIDYLT